MINVVLDIDGVLACTKAKDVQHAAFFKNRGAIITAIKTHYLFPGVIEFMKSLFQTEGVRVSFFSAGQEERNRLFVDELVKLSVPEEKYAELRSQVTVLSEEDLTMCSAEKKGEHRERYSVRMGEEQKDIRLVLKEGESLNQAVLIDDRISFAAFGQIQNLLYVPQTEEEHYERLLGKCSVFQEDGFRLLDCVFANAMTKETPTEEDDCVVLMVDSSLVIESERKCVKQGDHLLVLKTEEGFKVCYLDKDSKEYKETLLDPRDNEHLIAKLEALNSTLVETSDTFCNIETQDLVRDISSLVVSLNGRGRRICRSVNRIYYVAGLLFQAIEESKTHGLPISEYLFERQFELRESSYRPRFRHSYHDDDVYLLGLEKLRQHNSGLEFINPHKFKEILELPISEEDDWFLQGAIDNDGQGVCSIM